MAPFQIKTEADRIRSASVDFGMLAGLFSSHLIRANCQPRLVTRRSVLVQDALLDRLVDHRHGIGQNLLNFVTLARVERRPQLLDIRPDLGLMAAINGATLLALPHALLC